MTWLFPFNIYPALTYSLTWDGNTIGAESVTAVFGMGTGVAFLLLAPGFISVYNFYNFYFWLLCMEKNLDNQIQRERVEI